jgi:hypothetical protein
MMTAVYVDDFNRTHYVAIHDTAELEYLRQRYYEVHLL